MCRIWLFCRCFRRVIACVLLECMYVCKRINYMRLQMYISSSLLFALSLLHIPSQKHFNFISFKLFPISSSIHFATTFVRWNAIKAVAVTNSTHNTLLSNELTCWTGYFRLLHEWVLYIKSYIKYHDPLKEKKRKSLKLYIISVINEFVHVT